jgi:hypothetical protein
MNCQCGCGGAIGRYGLRFILGHNQRGIKQSQEIIERRAAPRRGVKRSKESIQATAAALRGRKLSNEHRLASSKGWLHVRGPLSAESESKRRLSLSKTLSKTMIGTERRALHWIIRDPIGIIYEFDNLAKWCRQNESRFLPDERPESKLRLHKRAQLGFNGMQRKDHKGQTAWKGWTLVSVIERKTQGAPDLLQRI